ncbi:hypothetical protein [Mucilaginibacter sp.]|uniref:hypothetical protein n=1 Tax=Mucilaginibacter sp. TaxID=1882438 RepID=UPI002ED36AE9
MKKRELNIGILAICFSIATVACSKKSVYEPFTATRNGSDRDGSYFLPSKVFASGDSVAAVGFMQTQVPFYMDLKTPKGKNNLKILQEAYDSFSLVLVKMDPTNYHKIIAIEPAPAELSRRFRQSLHTDTAKHRIN